MTYKTPYFADLHCHSTASDGSDSPTRVVERAAECGLQAIALTDHDTVGGVAEARIAGERLGVEVIAGAELTCYIKGREIHVLGYGLDVTDERLLDHCRVFQKKREERAREIGEKLEKAGVPVDMDAVIAAADAGSVGRPHVAKAILDAGHVETLQEAFDKYLAEGMPCYVPKMQADPAAIVGAIREAGGLVVLAHPGLYKKTPEAVDVMLENGIDGIECWHSNHDLQTAEKLFQICQDRGLVKTGGSDCHGKLAQREPLLGTVGLDKPRYEAFKKALQKLAVQ